MKEEICSALLINCTHQIQAWEYIKEFYPQETEFVDAQLQLLDVQYEAILNYSIYENH